MHTFADLAQALHRSAVYLSGLQSRFELPTFEGTGYSEAYLAFLQTVVHLRTLSITEEMLRDLWHIEKKLLVLLHAESTGSPTWFLEARSLRHSDSHALVESAREVLRFSDMGQKRRRLARTITSANATFHKLMTITNLLHFCKFTTGEIGIADGYFAGDAWTGGDEAFDRVSGVKFGWIDSNGNSFCDDRTSFSRPSESEVLIALRTHEALYRIANDRGLVR